MKQSLFTLEHTRQLTDDTYELVLSGDTSAITAPGQFVNIQLPGRFLRRPISICNWTDQALMLLVKVVGDGTRELVRCVPGTELDVLSGLGNGFDPAQAGDHPVLAGGGIRNVPECDYVLCCGPLPILKAVHSLPQLTNGQFSFEARMGCGFGACMGCSIPTRDGYKRVCKDGPILYKEEIVW